MNIYRQVPVCSALILAQVRMSDKSDLVQGDVLQNEFYHQQQQQQQQHVAVAAHQLPPASTSPRRVTVVRIQGSNTRSTISKVRLVIAVILAIKFIAVVIFLIIWYN